MKNSLKIIIIVGVVVLLVIGVVVALNLTNKGESKSDFGQITSAYDLTTLIEKIYAAQEEGTLPGVQTQEIDVTDKDMVKYITGYDNNQDFEYVVVSEPLMSSQAYSFVLAKVKSGVDASAVAKNMLDNIDIRKWICVSAEKVYATNSGDVVCLVMSNEKTAKSVYEEFKKVAGTVGKEYERTEEAAELPEDMY